MLPQGPSQIYKAQLRGHEESENYRCLATLNYGSYTSESRKPFGKLTVLNDETLAPQQSQSFTLQSNETIILIPLVGTIDYTDRLGNKNYLETEEIQILKTAEPTLFEIRNPYETELINYLQIRLNSKADTNFFEKKPFDFKEKNNLLTLLESDDYKISIGIFTGRSEGIYTLKNTKNGAFAFIINGAFEFQNRLLESRDALAIWDVTAIEFEALSENALILLIETPLQ